jgi:hypothetical protein
MRPWTRLDHYGIVGAQGFSAASVTDKYVRRAIFGKGKLAIENHRSILAKRPRRCGAPIRLTAELGDRVFSPYRELEVEAQRATGYNAIGRWTVRHRLTRPNKGKRIRRPTQAMINQRLISAGETVVDPRLEFRLDRGSGVSDNSASLKNRREIYSIRWPGVGHCQHSIQ